MSISQGKTASSKGYSILRWGPFQPVVPNAAVGNWTVLALIKEAKLLKNRTDRNGPMFDRGQQLPTLLDVTCCVRLHTLLHVVICCCVLLGKVWNRSNFSANNSQHFFCSEIAEACTKMLDRRLHSSSNIAGATHAHNAWFTKTYGFYPSHDALQVPTLLGVPVCTPLPTRTQQLPTLLAQQCWELLGPFARNLTHCKAWKLLALFFLSWCSLATQALHALRRMALI